MHRAADAAARSGVKLARFGICDRDTNAAHCVRVGCVANNSAHKYNAATGGFNIRAIEQSRRTTIFRTRCNLRLQHLG
jgi:hypothetical protein